MTGQPGAPTRIGRRALIGGAGLVAAGGAAWFARDTLFDTGSGPGVQAGAPSVLPSPKTADVLPAGVQSEAAGVVPFRVPNDDFFQIDTAFGLPKVDAATWKLRIHGMVEREVSIDYATLLAGELVERDITLSCVSNDIGGDLVGNAAWLGLPLAPLIKQAGPTAGADMVFSTSVDDWTASTPLSALTDGREALLAVGMNGAVLPQRHGFPVRMVVPGLYGFVSATKWLVDLEVTTFAQKTAYWTMHGWSPKGPVKLASRIDVPRDGAQVKAGTVAIGGVAWAPGIGISAVQVSVDEGPWEAAHLATVPTPDTWRQWAFAWTATAGKHTLRVRATDAKGLVQTGDHTDVIPDGATGWHTIDVTVA